MRRYVFMAVLVIAAMLAACAPTPQVIEVPKEVIVEKEKVVTVEVEKQVEVEKKVVETVVVEKEKQVEVVVTATPVPPTAVPQVPTEKQMGGTLNVWLPNGWPDVSWLHLSNWESTWATSPMREPLFFNLPDGTMVVIELGRDHINQIIPIAVTSVLQTSAGRMVFGKLDDAR